MSHDEVARVLGVSRRTVNQLHRRVSRAYGGILRRGREGGRWSHLSQLSLDLLLLGDLGHDDAGLAQRGTSIFATIVAQSTMSCSATPTHSTDRSMRRTRSRPELPRSASRDRGGGPAGESGEHRGDGAGRGRVGACAASTGSERERGDLLQKWEARPSPCSPSTETGLRYWTAARLGAPGRECRFTPIQRSTAICWLSRSTPAGQATVTSPTMGKERSGRGEQTIRGSVGDPARRDPGPERLFALFSIARWMRDR